jgi:hypothetical protein
MTVILDIISCVSLEIVTFRRMYLVGMEKIT